MSLAVVVDATDGTLARLARVKEIIPWFDGDRLEDIVDYLNYVLVPCVFMIRADLLPQGDALWLVALPLLASAYGFCQKAAKTSDHFFLGFPSYWNIVAFYFYVMKTPLWINAFLLLIFSALVFVPIRYLYPSRSPILRGLTVSLGVLWGIMVQIIIYRLPHFSLYLVYASLLFPAYYLCISFWLEIRRRLI
jgi:phosphatidylcholine synthase